MFSVELTHRFQPSYLVSCFKIQLLILFFIVVIETIQKDVSVGEKASNPVQASARLT